MHLPPELIGDIAVFLDKDIHTLYSCALVCHTFHNAATPLLYKRIHVSPPKVGLAWQVVEVSETLDKDGIFIRIPHDVGYAGKETICCIATSQSQGLC
jgi:F-box-like